MGEQGAADAAGGGEGGADGADEEGVSLQKGAPPGEPAAGEPEPPPIPPAPAPDGGYGAAHPPPQGPPQLGPYVPPPFVPPPPPPSPYGAYPQGPPAAPYSYPYGPGWQPVPLPNGRSVAALILGIVALAATFTCWGSLLSLLVGPVAIGIGISARRAVDRGEASGRPQATAAVALGSAGTAIGVLFVVLVVLGLSGAFGSGLDPAPAHRTGGGDGSSINASAVRAR